MQIVVTFQDRAFSTFAARLKALGADGRTVLASALNAGMAEVRQTTIAAETAQTGLTADTINRAQKPHEADAGGLEYRIESEGGDVRLKFFGAQETPAGVLAHPFNRNQVFQHAFMKGGRFPNRVTISKLNGNVLERVGSARRPTRVVKSGVVIPTEMTKGRTAAAFEGGVASIVAPMIVTKLGALLP